MISSLKLENINKQYSPSQFCLKIDNLEFNNKHINVVVGPNGSGKSAMLSLIGLLNKPDTGKIVFRNNTKFWENQEISFLRKKIGFVVQNPYLFNMNVFKNIALGLKIRKYHKNEIEKIVKGVITDLNINHIAYNQVKSLSGGELRKVAIAQVLVFKPEILLLDEPMANIDKQSQLCIENILKEIQTKYKILTIVTTHSFNQAYRLSSDIVSLANGKVVDFIHENVFSGAVKIYPSGIKSILVNQKVEIFLSTEDEGFAHIAIDPEDIILSKKKLESSVRNCFPGKVLKIESLGINVRILIDIQGVPIYSVITRQSFDEMKINLSSEIFVSFKVNSVKVV